MPNRPTASSAKATAKRRANDRDNGVIVATWKYTAIESKLRPRYDPKRDSQSSENAYASRSAA